MSEPPSEIDVPREESLALYTGPTLDECVAAANDWRFSDEFVGAMFRRFVAGRGW